MKKKEATNPKRIEDHKLFAFLAVLLSVIGFLLALGLRRDNKYIMFYAKQSLILFITGVFVEAITSLLGKTIIGLLAIPTLWIGYIILWIIGLINSLSGKMYETPIVGKYAEKINL
ncbi:MAG: hypothetical protein UT71_C0031G0001 [Parcubacteria group bacterium GW2011_GWF2_40_10]|nr:MAG: hypothetical protein UT71_C0031G0001 [Parcubacteria group bacterium GW2011_GWF2_40_10]HIG95036.1 hypothetical protein [Nanoarchaeota archaeon]HIH62853.1 hypothetical protein [Nanoarchaeota archaeon]HIJ10270.1 hypothetical protein [Nanoarchaeota archaeon]